MSKVTSTMNAVFSNVFHRRLDREPLHAVRTEGNYIYLEDGRKLLDGGVSAAVTSIGYGDKRVIAGMVDQLQTVPFAHSGTFTSKVCYNKILSSNLQYSSSIKINFLKVIYVENGEKRHLIFLSRMTPCIDISFIQVAEELADELTKESGMKKALFVSGGSVSHLTMLF
jgi:adenosylmethionine-8-amino-7-oxononanoate aminotransferase